MGVGQNLGRGGVHGTYSEPGMLEGVFDGYALLRVFPQQREHQVDGLWRYAGKVAFTKHRLLSLDLLGQYLIVVVAKGQQSGQHGIH